MNSLPADDRPTCPVKGCVRPVIMRDRVGERVRWRTRCYWHHRYGDNAKPPERKQTLTDGMQCSTRGCRRAPEAFSRPDGRVYVRSVCRVCRMRQIPAEPTKAVRTPRQAAPPSVSATSTLSGASKAWQETPLWKATKNRARGERAARVALVRGGVWVRDDDLGWFVPDSQVKAILDRNRSTFDLAKNFGLPSRAIVTLQSESSKGRLKK